MDKLLYTNTHHRVVDIIDLYEIDIFSCDKLIDEFRTVLKYNHLLRYKVNVPLAVRVLKEITTQFTLSYPIRNYIPEDRDDNYVIALALQTISGFVTSGDEHILARKKNLEAKYRKLRIITKNEFEKMFPL